MIQLPLWPSDTTEQIENIIGMIGRNVEFFYIYSSYACPDPTDSLDPITNKSTNSFCATCSGEYWIPLYSGVTMSAHITWKFDYENYFGTGGINLIGDARVKVLHSEERENIIKESKFVLVDNRVMNVERITLLGAPGINRIVVDVKEREEEDEL